MHSLIMKQDDPHGLSGAIGSWERSFKYRINNRAVVDVRVLAAPRNDRITVLVHQFLPDNGEWIIVHSENHVLTFEVADEEAFSAFCDDVLERVLPYMEILYPDNAS